uniref:Pellino n=1 Tax=Rhipicephalus appendiculatus TaxID=34631 RepID=A0A131YFW3_RHIAP
MTSTRRGPFSTRRLSTRHLVFAYRLWNSSINQETSDRFRVGASWSRAYEAEGNQGFHGCLQSLLRCERRRHPGLCRKSRSQGVMASERRPQRSATLKTSLAARSDDVWTL